MKQSLDDRLARSHRLMLQSEELMIETVHRVTLSAVALQRSRDLLQKHSDHSLFAPKFAVSAITKGVRQEVGDKLRVTSIEPGAVDSDLKFNTSGTATETILDFYEQAIPAAPVARAIAFAIEQPADVNINAIVIRPTAQQF
jgi:NADP-dependent 3-hydroxy acid dehydrogenase YdfG